MLQIVKWAGIIVPPCITIFAIGVSTVVSLQVNDAKLEIMKIRAAERYKVLMTISEATQTQRVDMAVLETKVAANTRSIEVIATHVPSTIVTLEHRVALLSVAMEGYHHE